MELYEPSDFELDHDLFRHEQLESILWGLDLPTQVGIMEAETGSGKTAFARAMASRFKTVAVCRTRNLQATNYADRYGFDELYGRGNYKCILSDNMLTAAECEWAEQGMRWCPMNMKCEYYMRKRLVLKSRKASVNYAYWLAVSGHSAAWEDFEYQVLDEAHEVHLQVIEHSGSTVTESMRKKWELDEFPVVYEMEPERQAFLGISINPHRDAIDWLTVSRDKLRVTYGKLRGEKKARECEILGKKLSATISALHRTPNDWFIQSGPRARLFKGKRYPGFVCKPLTARHHYAHYFPNTRKVVLMSATIGKVEAFVEELGIDEYSFRRVESVWPPEVRPIEIYDAPRMSKTNLDKDSSALGKQADMIAEFVKSAPGSWSGLALVTRRDEVGALAKRLSKRGLEDRVFAIPGWDDVYVPTDEQVKMWHERLRKVPNSIAISCNLWTGYDGVEERLLMVCKVPFGSLAGTFNVTRMERFRKTYSMEAGNLFAQGLGRIWRGERGHYIVDGQVNKRVAVFDGSWSRLKSYIPKGVKEAFVKV